MDDPGLDRSEHECALRGLGRIHTVTGTANQLWRPISKLFRETNRSRLSLMDVGCGDGVLIRKLCSRAEKNGWRLDAIGCDFSDTALEMARSGDQVTEYHQLDVTQDELPGTADIVLCSLFLHHFSASEAVSVLKKFASAAQRLVLIDDLLRTRLGYLLCWLGVHLFSRSRVVHVDGLLSVRAAYSEQEMQSLLDLADMQSASIDRHWPERFLVQWTPSGE